MMRDVITSFTGTVQAYLQKMFPLAQASHLKREDLQKEVNLPSRGLRVEVQMRVEKRKDKF